MLAKCAVFLALGQNPGLNGFQGIDPNAPEEPNAMGQWSIDALSWDRWTLRG
jgi:hypothetical protein